MTPLSHDDILRLLDQFKKLSLDDQCRKLDRTYRDASQTILRVIMQMNALTEMTQIMQDLQRAHGYTLPAELIETFQEFTARSAAMADAWVKNNGVMARCVQLHSVTTNTHPHFKL